jgi:hypothetical protein
MHPIVREDDNLGTEEEKKKEKVPLSMSQEHKIRPNHLTLSGYLSRPLENHL